MGLQETKRTFAEVKKCHFKCKGYFCRLGLKGALLPLFNQGSSGAGSEPVPFLEAVLWVTTAKELEQQNSAGLRAGLS